MTCSSWILGNVEASDGKIKLLCFPFAGGGASFFRKWRDFFPGFIEIVPVQLPGRENRMDEAGISDADNLLEGLLGGLAEVMTGKFAFWGHSMGGLMAARLAMKLKDKGFPMPVHIFLSSVGDPRFISGTDSRIGAAGLAQMTDGIPAQARANREIMAEFVRVASADLALVRSLADRDFEIDAPLTLFCGDRDPMVPEKHRSAWAGSCLKGFECLVYEGGHFFISSHVEELVSHMTDILLMHLI